MIKEKNRMETEVFSITAEDIKKVAEDLQRGPERSEEAQEVYDSLFKYFSQMISHSDFVKVVRCKDCKYRDRKTYINVVRRDLFFCNLHKEEVWATDFCSYGDREGNEQRT